MSNANWAYGTILSRLGVDIAEIRSITAPVPTADTYDVTTHDSVGGYKEFLVGLKDGGECTLEGNFYPGDPGQIALINDFNSSTVRSYTLTFPAAMGATMTFDGYVVTAPEITAPVDGAVGFRATIKVSGQVAVNVTASNNVTVLTGIEETAAAALDFIPNFAAGTYEYGVDGLDTLSTYIQLTATFAAGVGTVTALGVTQSIVSTVQSGQIVIGPADSLTDVVITIKEANKVATVYTIHVARP